MDMTTPEEYFKDQADFNKWLKELTDSERDHLIEMLREYGELKQSPRWVKVEERLPSEPGRYHVWMKMLENDSEFSTTVNFTLGCWEVEDEMFDVTKWLDESESPGSQEAVEDSLTPEQIKAIEDMADETCRLANTERRLLIQAAKLIDQYRLVAPAKDIAFSKKSCEWMIEFNELQSHFK